MIISREYPSELLRDFSPKFIQDQSSYAFSEFKVINCFKVKEQNSENEKCKNWQHGRSHKKYSIIFDAKYLKIIVKRSYWRENLFDCFRALFQVINTAFWEFESTQTNEKFDANFVKRKISMSKFNRKSMYRRFSEHAHRARQVNKIFDSIYKRFYSSNNPTLFEFTVDLIDTEAWASKFEQVDQKTRNWMFGKKCSKSRLIRYLRDSILKKRKSQIMKCSLFFLGFFSWLILLYVKSWWKLYTNKNKMHRWTCAFYKIFL